MGKAKRTPVVHAAWKLLPQVQRALLATEAQRAALQPLRSSDPLEVLRAHRLLDQVHAAGAEAVQRLAASPEFRSAAVKYGTVVDFERIEHALPQTESSHDYVQKWRREIIGREHPDKITRIEAELAEVREIAEETIRFASFFANGDDRDIDRLYEEPTLTANGHALKPSVQGGDDGATSFVARKVFDADPIELDPNYRITLADLDKQVGESGGEGAGAGAG